MTHRARTAFLLPRDRKGSAHKPEISRVSRAAGLIVSAAEARPASTAGLSLAAEELFGSTFLQL